MSPRSTHQAKPMAVNCEAQRLTRLEELLDAVSCMQSTTAAPVFCLQSKPVSSSEEPKAT